MLLMIWIGLSCGGDDDDDISEESPAPVIFLVKDSEDQFHIESSTVLMTEVIVWVHVQCESDVELDFDSVYEDHHLVLLKSGTVFTGIAVAFSVGNYDAFSYPYGESGLCSIRLRPSNELSEFPNFPYLAHTIDFKHSQQVVKSYPFQPYNVGEPSELIFEYKALADDGVPR